ncbi:MAG: tRNA (N(6)-L-threonylcarbamoyladenosine(37)-C(2))-methylthiotransferase MtaB [Planctomycetota bacterium]|nr:MAG: tRNA (N(6)-L-threonylcarbamoyladenosine(37)-C(2))-methylthiotransferase MtaB [Planctomycetota bacterium]
MPTLRTVTLGCKVNQYETEFVREGLLAAGYADARRGEAADLCVVNTCTVTHEGDAKSRQTIRRLAKDNPAARIVVMGCYATRAPNEVAALPGVAEVVSDKRELPDLLGRMGVVDVPDGISNFAGHHRAFIKVQDGCLLRCSFCIIPHVRPNLASRPVDAIVREAERLLVAGFRELVLTGIHLGHYGVDFNRGRAKNGWQRLSHLLARLMEILEHPDGGPFRVRLSSIEATEVTRELLDVMAAHPRRICPHLHVSMQSGSDGVLRRMRRRWGAQRFIDRCRLAQQTLDLPALTTDIIVGFPDETEAEFAETCQVVEELGFSKIHIFPFSPRRGTPAAEMTNQVAPEAKADRVRRLRELESKTRRRYHQQLLGRTLDVLVQAPADRPGYVCGTACRYAPVELPGKMDLESQIVAARAIATDGERIRAGFLNAERTRR